nr:MAG: putative RNA-dependent RNA polymerase [Trichoderma hamatum mycoophiovirus 1]
MPEYTSAIDVQKFRNILPASLVNHLETDQVEDVGIDYVIPKIEKLKAQRPTPKNIRDNIGQIRLPSRINNPLLPYPEEIKNYIQNNNEKELEYVHNHHSYHLKKVKNMVNGITKEWNIYNPIITTDINVLKTMITAKFSHRSDMIHNAAAAYAQRATNHELSLMAKINMNLPHRPHTKSPFISLLVAIHRLRVFIGRANAESATKLNFEKIINDEPEFRLFLDFSYIYGVSNTNYTSIICASGGHFAMYTGRDNTWFIGPISYLDYIFTVADIMNNLGVIRMMNEYQWANEFILLLEEMILPKYHHNTAVNFMKTMEGFLLMMSDYDESYAMNWKPILEVGFEIYKYDKSLSKCEYPFEIILGLLSGQNLWFDKKSILCRMIMICRKMSRNQMQEASALHKFIFYAEVDGKAGVMKFLKRVHTPRPMDPVAVKQITRLAKQEFFLSYCKKHKTYPNLEGDIDKISLLKVLINKHDTKTIIALPLSWWDNVTIFNCMDNTMTDDALEFAKDKGALKKEIHFGPGDSRKELLQVIETEDYMLKDFFADAPFLPKQQKVYSTNKHNEAYITKYPARLIEKEREQKLEARLFGNGELSNKHALSVVATKIKKALSYFDEQLMTPPDKQRKELLHKAAQSLIGTENYSLLLDIEGHNQSMQRGNTAELAEFCGNLFGERGWSTLPDYFGVLDVYHYDEYLDDVTLSNGQLGGIEGWLNPLWTMHTMLCIKLLRYMTSIDLVTSMTYSDDVNAIIHIPQATEPTIQSMFKIIMNHFIKFGMIVKMSQTNLSKHRVTILRQHYADGIRSDSTLKKLISTSGANNPMLMADSLEVAGICSSISSALEMSNHMSTCIYLKNYKIGLLLARLPYMLLARPQENSMISSEELPIKLATLLYQVKDDRSFLLGPGFNDALEGVRNDIAHYIGKRKADIPISDIETIMKKNYGLPIADEKFVDSADRLLYLQIYDPFIQDLIFYLTHLPDSIGGLGGSLCINLVLSGHSSGMSKSLHYLKEWIVNFSSNTTYFLKYMNVALTIDLNNNINKEESRIINTYWPSDARITTVNTSISSAIKSMVKYKTKNKMVRMLIKLEEEGQKIKENIICIFRDNYHNRIAQFYYENTSVHFLDLLINKIETSSGLLSNVRSISRLRNSVCHRSLDNIRMSSIKRDVLHPWMDIKSDVIDVLLKRRTRMFPLINMIEVDEPLYDDKLEEVEDYSRLFIVRQCSPQHFENGRRVYDTPDMGNEILYKGEIIDDDRLIGNKEELLAARLVAVTKWILTKFDVQTASKEELSELDVVKACNLALSTLTNQTLLELWNYSPNETGGEILHRIPNMRFNSTSYLRSEMNRSLKYTVDMNQYLIAAREWVDSNINFDYVRLRLLLCALTRDLDRNTIRFKMIWDFSKFSTFTDVQFIKPKLSKCKVKDKFTCYGELRKHTFHLLRYRFLATFYLTLEEQNDLALIPNLGTNETKMQLGDDLIEDLVFSYSMSLDREYMTIMPETIDYPLWIPLVRKIETINERFRDMDDLHKLESIKIYLRNALVRKRRATIISKQDTVNYSIQSHCLEYLENFRPKDVYHKAMVKRYGDLFRKKRGSQKLDQLNARYQNILNEHEGYRKKLAIALISEYIILFHFKVKRDNGEISFDASSSLTEYMNNSVGRMSSTLLTPELMVQMIIVGTDYIENIARKNRDEIKQVLLEISNDNHLADIIIPERLPNLKAHTNLNGDEEMEMIADSVEYEQFELPYKAMETFEDARALFTYARKCTDIGSDPSIFESITGSDSFIPQYALWRKLIQIFNLDESIKVCDLTAGRGDFIYATRNMPISSDSFAILDTFTRVRYHPKVRHDIQYDLTDMKTLKFIVDYDWIHIDISFTGEKELNMLDVILFLEENNLAYSIRVNSIVIKDYVQNNLQGIPIYDHYLFAPMNSELKPYQIYLVGVPGNKITTNENITMKNTTAFRSLALAYTGLLGPKNRTLRLHTFQYNSASVYLENNYDDYELAKDLCKRSRLKSERYYLDRFFSEIHRTEKLYFIKDFCKKDEISMYDNILEYLPIISTPQYKEKSVNDIGNVSEKSLPYHIKHLQIMNLGYPEIYEVDFIKDDLRLIEYFRTHHPLSEVRSQCNIIIGLRSFFKSSDFRTFEDLIAVKRLHDMNTIPTNTLRQQEYQIAIKLLILSAFYDNYLFGINYCHLFLQRGAHHHKYYTQILKIYRMISYKFNRYRQLILYGELTVTDIESVRHELVKMVEEKQKYKEIKDPESLRDLDIMAGLDPVEIDFEKLFTDLESFVNDGTIDDHNNPLDAEIESHLQGIQMNFDININERIDQFVQNNQNLNVNIFGQIDLGDEIDDYDFDLL